MMRAFLLLGLVAGCRSSERCEIDAQCTGELQACNLETSTCETVQCLESEQCGIGEWCNENHNCIPGCETDGDCLAGESCDVENHACVQADCRDSNLDCALFETCQVSTGECAPDPYPHCSRCDAFDWFGTECGEGACLTFVDGPDQGYCFAECQPGDPNACPRGMQCQEVDVGLAYCVAYCPDLEAAGLIPVP